MSAEEMKCRVCGRRIPRFPRGKDGRQVEGSELGQLVRLLHMKRKHPAEWREIWQDFRYLVRQAGEEPVELGELMPPD